MFSVRVYNVDTFLLFQQTAVQSTIEFLFCIAHKIKQTSSVAIISADAALQQWMAVTDGCEWMLKVMAEADCCQW